MREAPTPHSACPAERRAVAVLAAAANGCGCGRAAVACSPAWSASLTAVASAQEPRSPAAAVDHAVPKSARSPSRRAAFSGQPPKIDRAQPIYHADRQSHLRRQEQPRHRPGQRRDLLQQLHSDRRQGHLRPEPQQADGGRQRPAEGPQRLRSRAPTASRPPTTSATPSSSRSAWSPQDDTRIAAEAGHPQGGQRHRVRARQVHALPQRAGHAAALVHRRGPRSSTTRRRPPSPTRTPSSSCSACRSSTCPTSSTRTRR